MVDYRKPAMRDETWRRWKGGSKLAEQLRTFYTTPKAFARIAANNAMLSGGTPAANGELTDRQKLRGSMINAFFNNRTTDRGSRQLGSARLMAAAPAAADLPGQSGPKR